MKADVFVSYSSTNKAIADALVHFLEESQIRCWIAPRDLQVGADFAESIDAAISGVTVFVLLFSKASQQSAWCKKEANLAVSSGKIILPIRIEDVVPSGAMRLYLSDKHWVDAMPDPARHFASVREVILKICSQGSNVKQDMPDSRVREVPDEGAATCRSIVLQILFRIARWILGAVPLLFGLMGALGILANWGKGKHSTGANICGEIFCLLLIMLGTSVLWPRGVKTVCSAVRRCVSGRSCGFHVLLESARWIIGSALLLAGLLGVLGGVLREMHLTVIDVSTVAIFLLLIILGISVLWPRGVKMVYPVVRRKPLWAMVLRFIVGALGLIIGIACSVWPFYGWLSHWRVGRLSLPMAVVHGLGSAVFYSGFAFMSFMAGWALVSGRWRNFADKWRGKWVWIVVIPCMLGVAIGFILKII